MPIKKDKMRLNPKQQAFVDSYMKCFSPKQAALDAGYSPNNPSKVGYSVMQSPAVQNAIKEEMEKRKGALNLVPFESIILQLVEIVNDESLPNRERMKAADLLIKYKKDNKWEVRDANTVNQYVDALREQVGDVWSDVDGTK